MKKSFLSLSLLMAVSATSIFANPFPVDNPRAESAFKKQFSGASHVEWSTTTDGYFQAIFTWANHRTIAYYSPDAEFVGSIRNLFFNQLPLTVMRTIENKFGSDSLLEITEITNGEGTSYSVLLDQKEKRFRIVVSSSGDIVEKEKVKK